MGGLTARQAEFVRQYLIDLNATQAAIRAGYSAATAQEQGSRLLSNVMVAEAVAQGQEERTKRTEITADRVLKELALVGFANMQDYMSVTADGQPFIDLSALTREQAAAISEFTMEDFVDGRGEGQRDVKRLKFKLHSKLDGLTQIGRHLGMFTDKTEHLFDLSRLKDMTEEELNVAKRLFARVTESPSRD